MNNLDKIQMDTDITYSLVSIYQAQLKKCKDKKEINYRLFLKNHFGSTSYSSRAEAEPRLLIKGGRTI
jgi:hypothetical protein